VLEGYKGDRNCSLHRRSLRDHVSRLHSGSTCRRGPPFAAQGVAAVRN